MKSIQSLHPMIFCCKFCPDGTRNLSPPWLWKFESRIASSNTCCHSKHNLCSLTWSVILYHAFGQQRPSSLLYALPKLDHNRQWCDLPWCVLLEWLAKSLLWSCHQEVDGNAILLCGQINFARVFVLWFPKVIMAYDNPTTLATSVLRTAVEL